MLELLSSDKEAYWTYEILFYDKEGSLDSVISTSDWNMFISGFIVDHVNEALEYGFRVIAQFYDHE